MQLHRHLARRLHHIHMHTSPGLRRSSAQGAHGLQHAGFMVCPGKAHGIAPGDRAVAIGGGAKSALWRQIVADALDLTLVVTERSDSSLGSCMCAGVAVGYFANLDDAVAHTQRIVEQTHPIRENTEKYQSLFKKYKKIGRFLSELKD